MRARVAAAVLATSVLAFAAAGAAVGSREGHGCGHDRWDVKTLSDPAAPDFPRLADAKPATVSELVSLEAPATIPRSLPRQEGFGGIEHALFRVRVHLDGWKLSIDDRDIHLVVLDPQTREPMIVEFPHAECIPPGAGSANRRRMVRARESLMRACASVRLSTRYRRLLGSATITGVGFWDRIHGQTGVADNGVELHPVLSFRSSNCRA